MGMFDQEQLRPMEVPEGQPFRLLAVRVGPEVETAYGPSRPAMLKLADGWYSVFGEGLLSQVRNMEDGDLPADVRITRRQTKSGTMVKLLERADKAPVTYEPSSQSGSNIPF